MDVKISNDFRPFVLEIKIESAAEARTLWHVLNRSDMEQLIKWHGFYNSDPLKDDLDICDTYSKDLASLNGKAHVIEKELNYQGVSLFKDNSKTYVITEK